MIIPGHILNYKAKKENKIRVSDMFKELNPLLHSELRLAVMSLLISVEEADFVYIRQQTVQRPAILVCNWINLPKRVYSCYQDF